MEDLSIWNTNLDLKRVILLYISEIKRSFPLNRQMYTVLELSRSSLLPRQTSLAGNVRL